MGVRTVAEQNADPEAWLADQLAQLEVEHDPFGSPSLAWAPGEPAFAAVEKLAQEYGEMCATRVRAEYEDLTIVTKDEDVLRVLVGGVEVRPLAEVFPDGGIALREMGAGLDDGEVVR